VIVHPIKMDPYLLARDLEFDTRALMDLHYTYDWQPVSSSPK